MRKISYFGSHKKKRRFAYEFFGYLHFMLFSAIAIYYIYSGGFSNILKSGIFLQSDFEFLKTFYFSLIFISIINAIFIIGMLEIFKSRVFFIVYPVAVIAHVLLFMCGFLFDSVQVQNYFNYFIYSNSLYFLLIILIFFLEKRDYSRYGSLFMRIFTVTCSVFFFIYSFVSLTGIGASLLSIYTGYIQVTLFFIFALYALANAIYISLKYVSTLNVK